MIPSTVLATTSPIEHSDYLILSYRPDLRMVVLRWLRDASLPELQLGHQAALHLARQHAANHWFVDVRRRLLVNNSHSSWVIDEFLPQVAALLSKPLRVAYLMTPSRQQLVTTQPDLTPIFARSQAPDAHYRLQAFLDEASAMAWLFTA